MRYILIIIAVLLFSCNEQGKKHMRMPVSHMQEKCDADFDVFFEKFSADSVFQKEHTKFPLKDISRGDPYPKMVTEYLEAKDCNYYDFRKDKDGYNLKEDPYEVVIERQKDSVFYHWRGTESGLHYEFKFAFTDGCWYMVEMIDTSM